MIADLTDLDKRNIAALQKDCPLVQVTAEINKYGFWVISGTHNGEVKLRKDGKIWTPTRNEFRNAYFIAEKQRMFETKGTA
jgi:phage protein U